MESSQCCTSPAATLGHDESPGNARRDQLRVCVCEAALTILTSVFISPAAIFTPHNQACIS